MRAKTGEHKYLNSISLQKDPNYREQSGSAKRLKTEEYVKKETSDIYSNYHGYLLDFLKNLKIRFIRIRVAIKRRGTVYSYFVPERLRM